MPHKSLVFSGLSKLKPCLYATIAASVLTVPALASTQAATPILLDEDKFPRWAVFVLRINPLTYIVRAYREILLGHAVSPKDFLSAAVFAVVAFVCGGLIFRYMKRGFADVL